MSKTTVAEIPFKDLVPHEDNIRHELHGIEDLATSIKNSGLQTPLRVRENPDKPGTYTILAGHRRYAALTELKTKPSETIPVLLTEDDGQDDFVTMLVENLQRDDIDALEEADGMAHLVDFGMKQADIAARLGVSPSRVSSRVALSRFPTKLHWLLREKNVPVNIAVDFVKAMKHIPSEVIDHLADPESRTISYDLLNAIRTADRKATFEKGSAKAAKAGLTAHPGERDIPVPEGCEIVWANGVKDISELDDSVTDVIILPGPDGDPLFRPVLTAPVTKHGDSDLERRKETRVYKAEKLEFWQEVLGGRPRKDDILASTADILVALAGSNQHRIASKILKADPIKVKDDLGKISTSWTETFTQALAANRSKALLALAAAFAENSSGPNWEPEWASDLRAAWSND